MRLDYLKIAEFKNLRSFEINFDEKSQTTVLVGRNGSGKSNLLEALTLIYRDLDLGETPTLSYELHYYCRDYHIKIVAKKDMPSKDMMKILIKDTKKKEEQQSLLPDENLGYEEISYSKFKQDARDKYLPNYVFGYYSGPSNRMEQHFEKHQERFYQELIKKKDGDKSQPLRPLVFARLVHSQFVLLAFFTEPDLVIQDFLDKYLWIEGLDSVLFVMRQPTWKSKEGDPRFWNARGEVKDFLSKLYSLSIAPIRLSWKVPLSFRQKKDFEHLFLYLKDRPALEKLASDYTSQQEFFKALESTYISELLSEVRIKVKVRKANGSITFREMSEGEQQLIMVLGLLRFTKEDESLFLLDEPDTHLNPAWSLQYIDFLKQVVGEENTSHIIMTTHDPLTIAGLERKQVQIIQRNDADGKITARHPDEDPFRMGVDELLTSDLYGLRTTLSPMLLKLLDRQRELAIKEELSKEELIELQTIVDELNKYDITTSIPDPLYQPFVKAMTAVEIEEELQVLTLTQEQQEKRMEHAKNTIRKIKKSDEK